MKCGRFLLFQAITLHGLSLLAIPLFFLALGNLAEAEPQIALPYTLKQMEDLLPTTRLNKAQAALAELEKTLPPAAQPSLIEAQKLLVVARAACSTAEQALRDIQATTQDRSAPVPQEKYFLTQKAYIKVIKLEAYLEELNKTKTPDQAQVVSAESPYTLKQMEDLLPTTKLRNAQAALAELARTLPPAAQPLLIDAQKLRDAAQSAELIAEQAIRDIQAITKDKNYPVPLDKYSLVQDADVAVSKLEGYLTELKKTKPIDSVQVVPTVTTHTLKQMEDLLPEKRLKKARALYSKLEKALSDSDQESLAEAKTRLDAAQEAESRATQALRDIQAITADETAPVPEDKYLLAQNADKAVTALEKSLKELSRLKPQETKVDWIKYFILIFASVISLIIIRLIPYFKITIYDLARKGTASAVQKWRDWFSVNRLLKQNIDWLDYKMSELSRENSRLNRSIIELTKKIDIRHPPSNAIYKSVDSEALSKLQLGLDNLTHQFKYITKKIINLDSEIADIKRTQLEMTSIAAPPETLPPVEINPTPFTPSDDPFKLQKRGVIAGLILNLLARPDLSGADTSVLTKAILQDMLHIFDQPQGDCRYYDFSLGKQVSNSHWHYLLFTYPDQNPSHGLLFAAVGINYSGKLREYFNGGLEHHKVSKTVGPSGLA